MGQENWVALVTDINIAELRELATAALTHRHTESCYRNGSGPWCVFEPTNIDHWTVLLGLLDRLEGLLGTCREALIVIAENRYSFPRDVMGELMVASQEWDALNPTEADDE